MSYADYDDRSAPQRPGMWVRTAAGGWAYRANETTDEAMRHRYWFEQAVEAGDIESCAKALSQAPLPGERGYVSVRERLRIMHQRTHVPGHTSARRTIVRSAARGNISVVEQLLDR